MSARRPGGHWGWLLVVACVAAAACSDGSSSASAATVAGRGQQPAWWDAVPVEVPCDATATDGVSIPADALFDPGESSLREADRARLDAFALALRPCVEAIEGRWTVAGATDGTDSDSANEALGKRRAQVVADVLVRAGVPSDRLDVVSWGETRPVADEAGPDPAEARARNRRVMILRPRP
jgi:outer membrane protein OmpA-like peptidoglycan-associated protein